MLIFTMVAGTIAMLPTAQAQEGTIEDFTAQFEDWTSNTALANGYVGDRSLAPLMGALAVAGLSLLLAGGFLLRRRTRA